MNKILSLFLIFCLPVPVNAAWWFSVDLLKGKQEISDSPIEFELGNIVCGAGATKFQRTSDDKVMESRDLYCKTSTDTIVSVTATCHLPLYEPVKLSIIKGGHKYFPVLMCGSLKNDQ
jgi:hypothetical protein